jgi:hypothetical protein
VAALHVAGAEDRHEVADEDDQLATVGEQTGSAGGLDGVSEPGGVGAGSSANTPASSASISW